MIGYGYRATGFDIQISQAKYRMDIMMHVIVADLNSLGIEVDNINVGAGIISFNTEEDMNTYMLLGKIKRKDIYANNNYGDVRLVNTMYEVEGFEANF